MTVERIHRHIDEHFDAHLEQVRRAVRQPSISADGTGMAEMAELLIEMIREAGGEASLSPRRDIRSSTARSRSARPKTLLVYGMYDVQPVDGENWSVDDPWGGEIKDVPGFGPCLLNRGVFNSKGPLVHFFNALESFRAIGEPYPVNIKFMIEGEEELGSPNMPGFVEQNQERLQADFALFPFYGQDINRQGADVLGLQRPALHRPYRPRRRLGRAGFAGHPRLQRGLVPQPGLGFGACAGEHVHARPEACADRRVL